MEQLINPVPLHCRKWGAFWSIGFSPCDTSLSIFLPFHIGLTPNSVSFPRFLPPNLDGVKGTYFELLAYFHPSYIKMSGWHPVQTTSNSRDTFAWLTNGNRIDHKPNDCHCKGSEAPCKGRHVPESEQKVTSDFNTCEWSTSDFRHSHLRMICPFHIPSPPRLPFLPFYPQRRQDTRIDHPFSPSPHNRLNPKSFFQNHPTTAHTTSKRPRKNLKSVHFTVETPYVICNALNWPKYFILNVIRNCEWLFWIYNWAVMAA